MPKIGYGYAIYTGKPGLPPVTPDQISGLSLWLKADAGVITGSGTPFLSTIIISGAGTTTSNGTYIKSSGTDYTRVFSRVGGGGYIAYTYCPVADTDAWVIFDNTFGDQTYYSTDDTFLNWNIAYGSANPPSATTSNTTPVVVTTWNDQSRNGNNATGADTFPTLQLNAINGYPAIRINNDGSDVSSFIVLNNFNLKNSSTFIVVKQLNTGNSYARMLGFLGTNQDYDSDNGLAFVFNNTIPQLQLESNSNTAIIANLVANNVFALVSYKIDNSGNMSIFYNGASEATGQNANMSSQNSGDAIFIGQGSQNLTATGLYGDIAEVVMYNRAVTTQERQQIELYLNRKYYLY
jgi:hypothetical protein